MNTANRRTILITGVAGGVGQATARKFIAEGWHVIGTDRQGDPNIEGLATFLLGDVADEDLWASAVDTIAARGQGLDALVNNAASQICKPLAETSPDEWGQVMQSNLKSAYLSIRALTPMMAGRNAAIVNISSVHAIATSAGIGAYAASKGGLLALTRTAALELAGKGIRVNVILPGAVDTPMLQAGFERLAQNDPTRDAVGELKAKTPLGRIGEPREIAAAVYFLADHESSSFITGQTLVVDGGALARLGTE